MCCAREPQTVCRWTQTINDPDPMALATSPPPGRLDYAEGVAGSRRAESCAQHARAGMVYVMKRACGTEECSTKPSFGVTGSRRAEFCTQHARVGMVNVVSKRCSTEGCSTRAYFGVAGSTKPECCSQH